GKYGASTWSWAIAAPWPAYTASSLLYPTALKFTSRTAAPTPVIASRQSSGHGSTATRSYTSAIGPRRSRAATAPSGRATAAARSLIGRFDGRDRLLAPHRGRGVQAVDESR